MTKYYVILTDWEEVLQKMVAWNANEFIAGSFFREYKKIDDRADIVVIEAKNVLVLASELKDRYDAELDDVIECNLKTKMSNDAKCYAIFKSRYEELFDTFDPHIAVALDSDTTFATKVCDTVSRIMINVSMLTRYIKEPYQMTIIDVLFVGYGYTSIKRMLKNGLETTPIASLIDGVYFWRLVLQLGDGTILSKNNMVIPADSVFIS